MIQLTLGLGFVFRTHLKPTVLCVVKQIKDPVLNNHNQQEILHSHTITWDCCLLKLEFLEVPLVHLVRP